MDEFFNEVADRFENLTEDEKNLIRGMVGTPEYRVISKIFGPDFMRRVVLQSPSATARPRRGLGTR